MSVIKYLGELALASRLKMLSESLMQDVRKIYKDQYLNFEPRWFLTFYQLNRQSPMSITELAEAIGITHPAVNQIANELITQGLVEANIDSLDKRKRMLNLSEKGKSMLVKLIQVWEVIEQANKELLENTSPGFLKSIEKIESALSEKNMYSRVNELINKQFEENLKIIDFVPALREPFKKLNLEWLNKYFSVEEHDLEILENPEEKILKTGGFILYAQYKDQIIGTCALIKHGPSLYELAKMAVTEDFQGKKVGKKLAIAIIEKAREIKAKEVFLITHEKLSKAINLYLSLGFRKTSPLKEIQYERCGITMKLEL